MYNAMKVLINTHHYATKQDVINRLDAFINSNKLSQDEYDSLIALMNDVYQDVIM